VCLRVCVLRMCVYIYIYIYTYDFGSERSVQKRGGPSKESEVGNKKNMHGTICCSTTYKIIITMCQYNNNNNNNNNIYCYYYNKNLCNDDGGI
jgi:hypothetical protein